jgi:hypothetical protein
MSQRPLVLQTLHKNIQRMASLAICVAGAGPARPSTAVRLGHVYQSAVGRTVPVALADADRAVSYLTERALIRKYKARNAQDLRAQLVSGRRILEVQDWWLSDLSLRSRTGGEREQSFTKTVTTCQELDLLADKTLTVTSYGRLLVDIARERGLIQEDLGAQMNPFVFEPAFAAVAFYRVATYDVPLQRRLVDCLSAGTVRFQDLCLRAEQILREVLAADIPNSPATRFTRAWLVREIDNARKLAQKVRLSGWAESGGASVQTMYRPFEDMFLPRLEFMVDAGFVSKPETSRARYIYEPSPKLEQWREILHGGINAIEGSYFTIVAQTQGKGGKRLTDPAAILNHLSVGFAKYRGLTGYAPILESVMYANVATWMLEPWPYVEVADSIDALRALSTSEAPSVRILSDRYRKPQAFTMMAA